MGKRTRFSTLGIGGILVLLLVLVGCNGPAEKPLPKDKLKYQEPEITLYDNETDQKQKIKFEEYIAGVVAAEMEPSWPQEALAAQAILARTFTLHKIKYEKGVPQHGADASTSTEEFQAYDPSRITPAVKDAVKKTRGEVIKHDGEYVRAWFHSNAGGKTATPSEGLAFHKEKTPYIKSIKDPGQKVAIPKDKSWEASFTEQEVRDAVIKQIGKDPGEFTTVTIDKKGPSGRAEMIQLGDVKISGPAFRLGLGPEKMRSTLLDSCEVKDGKLVVTGRGYGHGVGMCQWGAYSMAKDGKSHEEIIHHYFEDVEIEKIWP